MALPSLKPLVAGLEGAAARVPRRIIAPPPVPLVKPIKPAANMKAVTVAAPPTQMGMNTTSPLQGFDELPTGKMVTPTMQAPLPSRFRPLQETANDSLPVRRTYSPDNGYRQVYSTGDRTFNFRIGTNAAGHAEDTPWGRPSVATPRAPGESVSVRQRILPKPSVSRAGPAAPMRLGEIDALEARQRQMQRLSLGGTVAASGALTGLGLAGVSEIPEYMRGRQGVANWQARLQRQQQQQRLAPMPTDMANLASRDGSPLPQTFNPFQVN